MENNEWAGATEVPAPQNVHDYGEEKKCEAVNCLDNFTATWPKQRRCERCRREKRPYKQADSPF